MNDQLLQAITKGKSLFDPRTKILLILTVALLSLSAGGNSVMEGLRIVLACTPIVLLLSEGSFRFAAIYGLAYFGAMLCELLVLPHASGAVSMVLIMLCSIFGRFLPGIAMGVYVISTTTVSEFICAMERMHIPQMFTIPVAVVFRFFPTMREEYEAIGCAMCLRGISFGSGNPMKMLEYRLIPLMGSCVRIGDELSAAALTRGLGAPVKRTHICHIGFGISDAFAFLLCGACLFVFFCSVVGVFG